MSLQAANGDEAREFLRAHPQVALVDLMIPDLNGVLRGKRVVREALPKVYLDGVNLPGSLFAMDISGTTIETTGQGFDLGDPDVVCRPVPGTLSAVPGGRPDRAQALLAMYDLDGTRYFADPRTVLRHTLSLLARRGITPVVALELEFYLGRKRGGALQVPQWPGHDGPDLATQVYGVQQLDDCGTLLDEIFQCAEAHSIPADTAISEYAPGQFEVNLKHQADAERACDHATLLKRLIKQVAGNHGLQATFMAKPYMDWSGSGLHVHMSLAGADGGNRMQGPPTRDNPILMHTVGGLARTAADFMAVFAPNANSFRRFGPLSFAPTSPCWGSNNRTVALRVPHSDAGNRRIEHRIAGADANPYLVTAAVLAGTEHGLGQQLDPGPATTGNAYDQHQPSLPDTWSAALCAFQDSAVAQSCFGPEFCGLYAACKQGERAKFNRQITPLEYSWYLRTV